MVHGDIRDEFAANARGGVRGQGGGHRGLPAGVTGEAVHQATIAVITAQAMPRAAGPDAPDSYCAITHGTGHGVGLDVHEPPLLDKGGPELLVGDAVTIEPGLYRKAIGGVRVEDMVVVTRDGCENLEPAARRTGLAVDRFGGREEGGGEWGGRRVRRRELQEAT